MLRKHRPQDPSLCVIQNVLQLEPDLIKNNSESSYRAWMVAALAPWAKVVVLEGSGKHREPVMAMVAKLGIKAPNGLIGVLSDAVRSFASISEQKTTFCLWLRKPDEHNKAPFDRGTLGMAIYGWGTHWRQGVLLALLVDLMEMSSETGKADVINPLLLNLSANRSGCLERQGIIKDYSLFLGHLRELDLLDAYKQTPIVDGNTIKAKLGVGKDGPWLKAARDCVLRWQFELREKASVEGAIIEVENNRAALKIPEEKDPSIKSERAGTKSGKRK
jgi:tRNA nucleotidyltransferase (CCA-adding enzyme)